MDFLSNLREISLIVFKIRKLRFLSSAPEIVQFFVDFYDHFNEIEERLKSIDQHPTEIQILLCDLFLMMSRSWEGYMDAEHKPRFILLRTSDVMAEVFCSHQWIRAYDDLSFEFFPIEKAKKFKKAQQNLLKNRKVLSEILKKKITLQSLKKYFEQTTFVYYSNNDLHIYGFSSLTRNVVYVSTETDRQYFEAQLFDGYCYWLIRKNRTPLTIISEELKIFSQEGFHTAPSDAYLERVYHGICIISPFKLCQYNSKRHF